jgi:hypothetical protein
MLAGRAVCGARFGVSWVYKIQMEKNRTGFTIAAFSGLTNTNRAAICSWSARNPFQPAFVNSTVRDMGSTILGGAIADRSVGSSPINIVGVHGPECRTRVCRA